MAGSTTDTSTELSPSYTYERPGTYLARFTATDPNGASATASVQVEVTSSDECPQDNVKSDEFEGDSLDTNRWQIIRPDSTRPPTVSGGNLNFPIDVGSLYGPGTSARNIIVQPLPDGEVEVTAKITTEALTQNYQQAGLRVYQDDNNWASIHMIYAGTGRDFEFIYENDGTPRNEAADKLGGIPATHPLTYWVKLISDGSSLRAEYSYDGVEFDPVGRVADISGWAAPQVGPVALSDQATAYPVARFDWIRFNPDSSGGGGGGGGGGNGIVDEFDGTALGGDWNVVRQNQAMTVGGGSLNIPAAPGDIYGGRNDAANLVLRDAPDGPWVATAKLNFEGTNQYQQAGIIVYGDDANFTKFGRIAHSAPTNAEEKFEFIYENAGTPRNEGQDSTGQHPDGLPGRLLGPADVRRDQRRRRTTRIDGSPAGRRSAAQRRCRRTPRSGSSPSATTAPATRSQPSTVHPHRRTRRRRPRPELRRRVRRHGARHRALGRERPRHAAEHDRRRWPADDHHGARRHLLGRHDAAAEQLHPPGLHPRGRGLDDRDEDRLEGERRLWPGWPDRLRRRQQLRQARPDRRRQPDADQPHRAAHGDRRDADRTGQRPADRGRQRDGLLPAAEQERHELHRRVLARRHDVAARPAR